MLKRFKRMFSTDDIISSTREELNKMIEDINRNTGRDLTLADAKLKELRKVIDEANRRLEALNSDLNRQIQSGNFQRALPKQEVAHQREVAPQHNIATQSDVALQEKVVADSVKVDGEPMTVTYSKNPIVPKAELKDKVIELYSKGLDIEYIAYSLNTTTTEVQLIIDMNF